MRNKQSNPFQVLELPTSASTEHILQRGQALLATARSDEQRQLYQWALAELTTDTAARLRHAINEMPQTAYEHSQPELRAEHQYSTLTHDDINLSALLDHLLAAELEIPSGDVAAIQANAPYTTPPVPFPLEMEDIIFG